MLFVGIVILNWVSFRLQKICCGYVFGRKWYVEPDLSLVIAVSKDFDVEGDSVLTRVLQAVAVPVIGNVCHVFMHGLNHVQVVRRS